MNAPNPSDVSSESELWRARFKAVAQAQGRYLYVLVVVAIFYLALDGELRPSNFEKVESVELPVIGIQVDPLVVWGTAPVVLALVCLAALGTFPALKMAFDKSDVKVRDRPFEAIDSVPTAIDFVVYVSSDKPWTRLGLATYPSFLTLFMTQASWMWLSLLSQRESVSQAKILLAVGGVLILISWIRLIALWLHKVRQMAEKEIIEL